MMRELFHPAATKWDPRPAPYWRIWAPFHGVMVLVGTQPA